MKQLGVFLLPIREIFKNKISTVLLLSQIIWRSSGRDAVLTLMRRKTSTMAPAKNSAPDVYIMAPTGKLLWTASVALIKPLHEKNLD